MHVLESKVVTVSKIQIDTDFSVPLFLNIFAYAGCLPLFPLICKKFHLHYNATTLLNQFNFHPNVVYNQVMIKKQELCEWGGVYVGNKVLPNDKHLLNNLYTFCDRFNIDMITTIPFKTQSLVFFKDFSSKNYSVIENMPSSNYNGSSECSALFGQISTVPYNKNEIIRSNSYYFLIISFKYVPIVSIIKALCPKRYNFEITAHYQHCAIVYNNVFKTAMEVPLSLTLLSTDKNSSSHVQFLQRLAASSVENCGDSVVCLEIPKEVQPSQVKKNRACNNLMHGIGEYLLSINKQ